MHIRLNSRTLRLISAPVARSARRWSSHNFAEAVFQRIAPLSQLLVLAIAIWGPVHAPWVYSLLVVFVHGTFVASNARTAWGMRQACKAVEECASTDWRAESRSPLEFDGVIHLIILPGYKESIDTMRETLTVLASHPAASTSYRVCLGCEDREVGGGDKALQLMREFDGSFYDIQFTLHPGDLDGEAAGKSSNVSWAARTMFMQGLGGNVITVMDADSCFAADWFAAVASKWVQAEPEARTNLFFVAPIFFDRNASDVAPPVACTDILWCAAGLGTMYSGSLAKLPTSAYAISTSLASRIGFWDSGPDAIGEDLHMSVKAWFETSGQVVMESIYSPASQCNIVGFRYPRDAGQEVTLLQRSHEWCNDFTARYGQAKRHMWGCLDSGYALRRLLLGKFGVGSDLPPVDPTLVLEDAYESPVPSLDLSSVRSWSPDSARSAIQTPLFESPSGAGTPISDIDGPFASTEHFTDQGVSPSTSVGSSPSRYSPKTPKIPIFRLVVLLSRLYEAHFNLGYLFVLLAVAPYFNPGLEPSPLWKLRPAYIASVGEATLPRSAIIATAISAHLGTVALTCTVLIFVYYERFHHIATTTRWEGRPHLGTRAFHQTIRTFPSCLITYTGLPFTLFFGILPLYHAQALHMWSNRLNYQVSVKPSMMRTPTPRPEAYPMRDIKTSLA